MKCECSNNFQFLEKIRPITTEHDLINSIFDKEQIKHLQNIKSNIKNTNEYQSADLLWKPRCM